MTSEEDKNKKYTDSLDSAASANIGFTVKKRNGKMPAVGDIDPNWRNLKLSTLERVELMIESQGGVQSFFDKFQKNEIDMEFLLNKFEITEEDMNLLK